MNTCVRDRQILPTGLRRSAPVAAEPAVKTSKPAHPPATPPTTDYEIEALRCCELGKLHLELGRYQEALAQVEQALTHHPHHVESWYSRADVLACLGRYDDALQCLDQAQTLAGFTDLRGWVQKAVLLILLEQPAAALTCCNQALWLSPRHTQAWLFRGVALHRLGRRSDAYRSYRRATGATLPTSAAQALRQLYSDLQGGTPAESAGR